MQNPGGMRIQNRVVQHRACWDYFPEKREGWRVTTVGEKPYLAN